MQDNRPFPTDVRVAVKNENRPEPDSDDRFSGHCTFQYGGELYDFPPGKAMVLLPEVAFWMFLFDTRTDINRHTGVETPRNYRDKMSTGVLGNSGIGSHITLYEQKLASLGWANNQAKRHRFERFAFKAIKLNQTISAEEFSKI